MHSRNGHVAAFERTIGINYGELLCGRVGHFIARVDPPLSSRSRCTMRDYPRRVLTFWRE
jgi:hypothetical protein